MVWFAVWLVLGCSTSTAAATDASGDDPEPGMPSDSISAPIPSEEPLPALQVPAPGGDVPSPVAPSEPADTSSRPTRSRISEKPGDFIDFAATELRTTYNDEWNPLLTIAKGNVIARYKYMVITSEIARVDHVTDIAVFEGNVAFQVGVQRVCGECIQINLVTGQWSFTSASAEISPQFMQGYIVAPLFSKGKLFEGVRDRQMTGLGAEITSCNLKKPHYDLVARSVAVYPRSKIVLRDVSAYALGRKVMTLPRLVVPLREIYEDPDLVPRAGKD